MVYLPDLDCFLCCVVSVVYCSVTLYCVTVRLLCIVLYIVLALYCVLLVMYELPPFDCILYVNTVTGCKPNCS
jgi:hypothetical protein